MKNTIDLPEKLAKELSNMVDKALDTGQEIVITAWGFELVIHTVTATNGIKGYLNDTSGG